MRKQIQFRIVLWTALYLSGCKNALNPATPPSAPSSKAPDAAAVANAASVADAAAAADAAVAMNAASAADAAVAMDAASVADAASVPGSAALTALLKRGRAAADKLDFVTAVAAFREARRLSPHDPQVLAELGGVLFQQNKLNEARAVVKESLQAEAFQGATSLAAYNLGRIEEAAGNDAEALNAYNLSLAVHQDYDVEQARQRLQTRLASSRPVLLDGPYSTPNDLCARLRAGQMARERIADFGGCKETTCQFLCPTKIQSQIMKGLPPPLDEARLYWSEVRWELPVDGTRFASFLNAAVRIGKFWYGMPDLTEVYVVGGNKRGIVTLERAAVEPVGPGGTPLLVVRLETWNEFGRNYDDDKSVTVIGAGPEGKPWRIGPIPTVSWTSAASNEGSRHYLRYEWRFKDGALEWIGLVDEWRTGDKLERRTRHPLHSRYPLVAPSVASAPPAL